MPGGGHRDDQVHSGATTTTTPGGGGYGYEHGGEHEKKGMMDKIKEKLPGGHHH
ncbi:UNVERIFIED_CONTAM: hypothetical protein Sradi_3229100 [Sesamum radiatum]|uniref:Dehydrin n=1 Tax=Sesamum radiatum TaxID=300843 RepID=A0AAW2RGR7_SESRA